VLVRSAGEVGRGQMIARLDLVPGRILWTAGLPAWDLDASAGKRLVWDVNSCSFLAGPRSIRWKGKRK
jgi:hypothetical protein